MKYKLRMTPDQVIQNAVNAVKQLRSMGCQDIEFSPEDAGAPLLPGLATWRSPCAARCFRAWALGSHGALHALALGAAVHLPPAQARGKQCPSTRRLHFSV
jgi:hypothetical protein